MNDSLRKKFSITAASWYSQLSVAFALMTVIPLLTFVYFLSTYIVPNVEIRENLTIIIALNIIIPIMGVAILARMLKALTQFKDYLEALADGNVENLPEPKFDEVEDMIKSARTIVEVLQRERNRLNK